MEGPRSLEDLLDLQAVDLDIDRLLDRRQNLPELARYREIHAETERLGAELTEARRVLRETGLELDRANGELELGDDKLHREENRLFAGGLGARDVEHLRREVEMLRRKKGEMEELVLGLMERREEQEAAVPPLEAALDAAERAKAEIEASIAAQWKEIDGAIAVKEERKAAIIPLIDEALLELYERLRGHLDGVGVGRLAEGTCGGCHLRLSAAEQAEALRQDPPRCIHCDRILVPQ